MIVIIINFKVVCFQVLPAELSLLGLLRHFPLMVYSPDAFRQSVRFHSSQSYTINMYNIYFKQLLMLFKLCT
jgi:hypothetical protein